MDRSIVPGIIGGVLWPLVAIIALLLFRLPVMRLANEISARTRKVSFHGLSVELEVLQPLTPNWAVSYGVSTDDVRRLSPSEVFDSYASTLFEQLLRPREAEYAVVNLGLGKEWLTSRLFIFSLVLGEVSRLRALVFLETAGGTRRRYLGLATPGDVRIALARRYPWLEQAFAVAYAAQYPVLNPDEEGKSRGDSPTYMLEASQVYAVINIVRKYVENIQRHTTPPPSEQGSYVSFPSADPISPAALWERGEWIDGERLERDLTGCLEYSWYTDAPELGRNAKVAGILRRSGRVIAVVDDDRRFKDLVDREALVVRSLRESEERSEANT
jgi:hypothetical protein